MPLHPPDAVLSTEDLADMTGLTARRIDYLCRFLVFGEHNEGPGSGGRRRFTVEDAHVAAVLSVLGDLGGVLAGRGRGEAMLSAELAREVSDAVRCGHGRWLVVEARGAVHLADEIPAVPVALLVDLQQVEAGADLAVA